MPFYLTELRKKCYQRNVRRILTQGGSDQNFISLISVRTALLLLLAKYLCKFKDTSKKYWARLLWNFRGGLVLEWEHRDHSHLTFPLLHPEIWRSRKTLLWNITADHITSGTTFSLLPRINQPNDALWSSLLLPHLLLPTPTISLPPSSQSHSCLSVPLTHSPSSGPQIFCFFRWKCLRWWSHGLILQLLALLPQIQFFQGDLSSPV